jgi:hypothetical protein
MIINTFISQLLDKLSNISPRLEDSTIKLHIQIELQDEYAMNLLNYFVMLQPEYKYHWILLKNNNFRQQKILEIAKLVEFIDLQIYLISNNLLNKDEILWLDDAIHEVLIDN